jgi:toxic protein SymE
MNNFRELKIHSKHRNRTWDSITVPEIRLVGVWLNRLGFKEGKTVRIQEQKDKLVITLNDDKK